MTNSTTDTSPFENKRDINKKEREAGQKNAITGSLLGLMVGDSLGLPYEGISSRRISKLLKDRPRQRLIFGKGMISDDTEHAVMTAASLIQCWNDWNHVQSSLAWRLRWWFLRLPAGIGLATGRSIIKLWLGFPAKYSGVYSAGNGPAMRAPIIGVALGDQPEVMKRVVKGSTELTHKDPKAAIASLAVAQAAYLAAQGEAVTIQSYRNRLTELLTREDELAVNEFLSLIDSIDKNSSMDAVGFAKVLKQESGISGYIYHTVPMVLFIWLKHQNDFSGAIESMIRLGGDTDTTSAILGGVIGAGIGKAGIPGDWLDNIADWPITVRYVEKVAAQLQQCKQTNSKASIPLLPGPLIFIRNMVFLMIVLLHGFRRLLPPY
ncbi:ADP-ribosylglycohydrolase family protein [Hahella sp. CCB-MM4]|uniref:ADP-ribosylglycohydrolase family protein n=1 Tax=Hahella sp. (strain CCB-MM4) TaxID=1926491 RepID=UPI000B9C5ADA|nr:ADP-ribosylglycohydrolase family protein [Hahella sp. CCB-MM4]